MPRGKPRVTCRFHCTACDGHFSCEAAFNRHRKGSHERGTRYCADPYDLVDRNRDPALMVKSSQGYCRLSRTGPKLGVVVWTLPFEFGAQIEWSQAA